MLKCDCGCSMLVVDREEWEDGEVNYNISVQDSRYDHNYTTLWGRIKSAAKVLFGKPVYYSDIYIGDSEKLREFLVILRNKLYLVIDLLSFIRIISGHQLPMMRLEATLGIK
jgi:hypothetical protein